MGDDGEKEISEDENQIQDEIEFEEEIESLPPIVTIDDDFEKGNKIISQEDWGDSTQELHLENIVRSLNQINLNLDKIGYANKKLSRITNNFKKTNEHLWWLALGVKISLFLMCFGIICGLMFFAFAAGT